MREYDWPRAGATAGTGAAFAVVGALRGEPGFAVACAVLVALALLPSFLWPAA